MKPNLSFVVLEWHEVGDVPYVVRLRLTGTDQHGAEVDREMAFEGLVTVAEVQTVIAKMNNGQYRA